MIRYFIGSRDIGMTLMDDLLEIALYNHKRKVEAMMNIPYGTYDRYWFKLKDGEEHYELFHHDFNPNKYKGLRRSCIYYLRGVIVKMVKRKTIKAFFIRLFGKNIGL